MSADNFVNRVMDSYLAFFAYFLCVNSWSCCAKRMFVILFPISVPLWFVWAVAGYSLMIPALLGSWCVGKLVELWNCECP